jgi:hypothetical protein
MFSKIIKISIISIIALIIVGGGTVGGVYYYGIRQNKAIEVIGNVELTPADAKLGQVVTATILLKCPWHRKPLEAVAQTGKGASLLNAPEISRQSIGWGNNTWKINTEFKAYRTGNIPAGKIDVSYNRYDDKTTDLSKMFIIPPFKCTPLHLGKTQKIVIADAIKPVKIISNKKMYIIIAVLALLIIIAIILFVIRRYKKEKAIILPSWAIALNDLHSLRSNIKSGNITLNSGFISLTDIVRGYLEKRFKLPASKQTTEEFLEGINKNSGPLPEIQRPFLKEFMQASELVKFAKLPPDENTLNQALSKAETLVNETRPEDIEGGAK